MNTPPELLPSVTGEDEPLPPDYRQAYFIGYLCAMGYNNKAAGYLASRANEYGLDIFYTLHTSGANYVLREVLALCEVTDPAFTGQT
jgi:hypothetical protein